MVDEQRIGKDLDGSGSDLVEVLYRNFSGGGLWKTTKILI
jgi:hypothetical protein